MGTTVVGKTCTNRDAQALVTGRTRFAGDDRPRGVLHGVLLRSSCPHGKLLELDIERAKRIPGVKRILTAKDLRQHRFGRYLKDLVLLAGDKVLYRGEPMAVIVAVDEETAFEAREMIRVTYEPLPTLLDPLVAMREEKHLLHPEIVQYAASWNAVKRGNVCSKTTIRRGDIQVGFDEADVVLENSFETPAVHQCPLETQVALASRDLSGRLQVTMPTQLPFANQHMLAEALGLDPSEICVHATPSGGSFGSKIENLAGLYAALAACHVEGPVRTRFTREEEFIAVPPRHSSVITIRSGVMKDGRLTAWQARVVFDTGAYAWSGPVVMGVATMLSTGPYRIPHIDLRGYCVYTNKPPNGAFRGYGNPQAAFAHESQMDLLAGAIGMDPIDIRGINGVREGDRSTLGTTYRGEGLLPTLKAARDTHRREGRSEGTHRGSGVACIQHVTGGLPSSALLKVHLDGTISLSLGVPEIGTAVSAMASQVVSEELSLPLELIRVMPVNTDISPYDHGLGISRCAYNVGHAVRLAALDLKREVLETAAALFQDEPTNFDFLNGTVVRTKGYETNTVLTWNELVPRAFYGKRGPLMGKGSFLHTPEPNDETVEGMPIAGFPQFTFATHIADVEFDPETGCLKLLEITASHDVGKALNPQTVEGQIYGGIVQGIGYALSEKMVFQKGALANADLLDYKIPHATDIPYIRPVILEHPDPEGPYGAKGIGEPPIVPVAPAIANALKAAGGPRVLRLPLTPENVYRAQDRNLLFG